LCINCWILCSLLALRQNCLIRFRGYESSSRQFRALNVTLNGSFGAIQIDLTPLTLCITEDSAKQLMISQVINDNIQKMLKTLSKVNIRYLLNGL